MDHRRGQRWQIDHMIRITGNEDMPLQTVRLLELSYHGARLHLGNRRKLSNNTLKVWLPDMDIPVRALVVHGYDAMVGLLWIEYSPWVDHRLQQLMQESQDTVDEPIRLDIKKEAAGDRITGNQLSTVLPNFGQGILSRIT